MDLYASIVFVHALAGSVLIGTSLLFPLTRSAIRRARTVEELRAWAAHARSASAANPACALVLLGTGVYLGSRGWWGFAWFHVSLVLFAVNGLYAARVEGRAGAELGAAAASAADGPVPERLEALRWSPRLDLGADTLLANDVAALFIMLVKPGLAGCCAAIAVANGAAAALRRRRRVSTPTHAGGAASAATA